MKLVYHCIDCGKEKKFFPSEIRGKSHRYRLTNDIYRCRVCTDIWRKGNSEFNSLNGTKTLITIECSGCHKKRRVSPSSAKKLNNPYYCRNCFGETQTNSVTLICGDCGKKIIVKKSGALRKKKPYYCIKCKNKGERNHSWNGGKIQLICSCCDNVTYVGKIRYDKVLARDKPYYCKNCIHTNTHTGENNPNWRGGTSYDPYPPGWQHKLRDAIRSRDGHKCQICNINEAELSYKLDVHHIDYNKEHLDPKNLISLCRSCHTKTNFNRDNWFQLFQNKVCT